MTNQKIIKEWIDQAEDDIETRYPVHWPTNFTKVNAIRAKDVASKISDFIKGKLSAFMLKEK